MVKQLKKYFHNGDLLWKVSFCVSQVISVILLIASFCVPPMGVIDPSIFAGIGELFAFPALYSFYNIILSGRAATLKRGDMEIIVNEINNEKDDVK